MGTSHVDNSARLCHAASTVAMKRTLGYGATTCSYTDWIGTDLIVFFGSNTPNNQPVTMKYLYHARQQGAKVAVVNPYFEPGLRQYWVPSVVGVGGLRHEVRGRVVRASTPGGDLAFLIGVFKVLAAEGWIDREFVARSTTGFEEAKAHAATLDWVPARARERGDTRGDGAASPGCCREARCGIFVWSMGLTQHAHGVETLLALVNVGLARGWVGREKVGLMPIRGHSGVQGGAEVGCAPGARRGPAPAVRRGVGLRAPSRPRASPPRRWWTRPIAGSSTHSGSWGATSWRRCPIPPAVARGPGTRADAHPPGHRRSPR